MSDAADETRFAFGKNWKSFLASVGQDRVDEAVKSLISLTGYSDLTGIKFLDIGCGSGIFSLAAYSLGAEVMSIDYDQDSVGCALQLKEKVGGNDRWRVEQGSVLDSAYLSSLGQFDVVYSWGVLHHTGDMMGAFENIQRVVRPEGVLCLSIYNDQGAISRFWKRVKKIYCESLAGRYLVLVAFVPIFFSYAVLAGLMSSGNPVAFFRDYKKNRGMSIYHDWVDWLGGYPFEVAKPGEVFSFFRDRGFVLKELRTRNGMGCNEFVFRHDKPASA